MTCSVKVILQSVNASTGDTLTTLQLRYWRAIHAEFMTHRAFSRNAGSSRAIPVSKVLRQVWSDPAGPMHWGANQAGMQARAELVGWRRAAAGAMWRTAGKVMCAFAWSAMKLGLHKQVANRLLEPWQYINVVVSATDWENFYALRCHPDAQPEFQELAEAMRSAIRLAAWQSVEIGDWHLPYILENEASYLPLNIQIMLSAARCARVSYAPFDGDASIAKEVERYKKLVGSQPIHASPTEHQAQAQRGRSANFQGWRQHRAAIESPAT